MSGLEIDDERRLEGNPNVPGSGSVRIGFFNAHVSAWAKALEFFGYGRRPRVVEVYLRSGDVQSSHVSSSRVPAQSSSASDAVDGTLEDVPVATSSRMAGVPSSPVVDASYPQPSPTGVRSGGAA